MLTDAQKNIFFAAMDRVIPADDFPAASTAGVAGYFARLFAIDLRDHLSAFKSCLDTIDATAQKNYARSFGSLSEAAQDAVLAIVESGVAAALFAWFVDLVQEGYYADPANGGNKDAVSWRMVGYDPGIPGLRGTP